MSYTVLLCSEAAVNRHARYDHDKIFSFDWNGWQHQHDGVVRPHHAISNQQAINCNTEQFNHFYHGMLQNGVYLAPASYEAGFVSAAHSDNVIQQTLEIADKVLADVAAQCL